MNFLPIVMTQMTQIFFWKKKFNNRDAQVGVPNLVCIETNHHSDNV